MRRLALPVALLMAALVAPSSALSRPLGDRYVEEPRLAAVASRFAGHPVHVRCYQRGEEADPYDAYGAWGYVFADWYREAHRLGPDIHLAQLVCDGALAVGQAAPGVPLWVQSLGVLVLVHEAYHLAARYRDHEDEAATECRAVRHARYMAAFLGGEERWEDLKVGVLALHYLLVHLAPQYDDLDCVVPGWW